MTITATPLPRVTRSIPEQPYRTLPGAVDPGAAPARPKMTTTAAAAARPHSDTDGAELVRRVQAGGPDGVQAMGEFYSRYRDVVFRFIYFRTGNRPVAEDLAQDTWSRALKSISRYVDVGRDPGAWLVTIARNLIADRFKSAQYRLEVFTGDVLDADQTDDRRFRDPADALAAMDESSRLVRLVHMLNPEQRECIVLRFFGEYSVAETAAQLGKNEGAVKALQYRAVRSLARMLHGDDNATRELRRILRSPEVSEG